MADAGTIKLGIKVDDSSLNSQVEKAGGRAGHSFTDALKGAFSFAIGQNIFDFITNGFRDTIQSAFNFDSQMQSATTSFTTLLHSASKASSLVNALNQIDKSSTLDMDSLSKAAQEMLSFGVNSSSVVPTIRELSDVSQGNTQKFNALALAFSQTSSAGKLMGQDLLQYIAAGFNPLQVISQKTGKSMGELREEMSKGKISAADVADAFKIATSSGGKFYQASENATHTYTGQMAMLKASTNETLGNMIKPTFENISNNVLPKFNNAMKTVSNTFSSTHSVIQAVSAGLTAAFGPGVGNTFKVLATGIKDTFGWLIEHKTLIISAIVGIGSAFAAFKTYTTAVSTIAKLRGPIGDLIAGFQLLKETVTGGGGLKGVGEVLSAMFSLPPQAIATIAIIGVLAALAVVIIKNWGPISGFFKNIWAGIRSGAQAAGGAISGAFNGAVNGLKAAWSGVTGFFSGIWSAIQSAATAAWSAISGAVMAIVTPFVAAIQGPFNTLKAGLGNILNGIQAIFTGVWTIIKNVVLGIVLVFIDLITGDFKKLHSDLSGILNNIKNAFSTIWNGIKSVVTGIAQALVGGLGTIFRGGVAVLKTIGNGLKTFFTSLWNGIKSTAISVWTGLLSFFSSLPSRFAGFMSGVGNAIIHGFDSAIAFLKNLPGQMLQWGKDMIQGLIDGIKSMIGKVGDAIKGVGDKIRSHLHFSRPDEGPLVDYEDWMPDFMQGLANGILANRYRVVSAIRSLTSDIHVNMAFQPAYAAGYSQAAAPGFASTLNAGQQMPAIDWHPTYISPKPLGYAEIARQGRQDAQRIVLLYRKART